MLKTLPLELWQIILQDVVYIRGALETVMTTQFEWFEWRLVEKHKHAESVVNRLSLVRVCKALYKPALELLYEDIRLESLEQMESLRISLADSARNDSHLGRGWWTKRLDLPSKPDIAYWLLEPLIAHFPNLRILRFPDAYSIPYRFKNPLPKLRYTDLDPDDGHYIPTNLDTLSLILSNDYKCTFSNLTSLEVFFRHSLLQGYSFPRLQHLTLTDTIRDDLVEIDAFLDRHGHQLLSLRIDDSHLHLVQFLRKTPHLRELIFVPGFEWPYKDNTFPSVTHIGLLCGSSSWMHAFMDPIFDSSAFPNLKCMRLVDTVFTPSAHSPAAIEAWYQENRRAGVRHEDAKGNMLQDVIDAFKDEEHLELHPRRCFKRSSWGYFIVQQ